MFDSEFFKNQAIMTMGGAIMFFMLHFNVIGIRESLTSVGYGIALFIFSLILFFLHVKMEIDQEDSKNDSDSM